MAYVSFEEVKANVSIEQVINILNLELKRSGEQYRGCCPIHGGDNEREFVVTPEKNLWYCFKCEEGGDQIALYSAVKGVSPKEAALALNGPSEAPPAPQQGMKPLDYLESEHPAVEVLGFDPDVAEVLGIGYAKKGLMKGLVAVPIRNQNGRLVGYIGIDNAKLPKEFHL